MWSLSLADTLHSSKAETNIITWENDEQMNEVRIAKYLFVLYFTWGPHLLIFLLEKKMKFWRRKVDLKIERSFEEFSCYI